MAEDLGFRIVAETCSCAEPAAKKGVVLSMLLLPFPSRGAAGWMQKGCAALDVGFGESA